MSQQLLQMELKEWWGSAWRNGQSAPGDIPVLFNAEFRGDTQLLLQGWGAFA